MLIYKALLKYGKSKFKLAILEYCDPNDVISREQYYLDLLKPDYNILKIAGSSLGYKHSENTLAKLRGRKLSEEIRAKMRGAKSPEHLVKLREHAAKLAASRIGRKLSEEHKQKISVSTRAARLGTKHKDETRLKIGVTLGIVIEVTDLEVGETVEYFSMREAARKLNTNLATIRNYINYKKPFQGRFLIVKKDNK
jgi:group I intron endonuclease